MKISLKIDCEGKPYIVLLSEKPVLADTEQCIEAELLELFICEAFENGIEIKNEADMKSRCDFASIRIKTPV